MLSNSTSLRLIHRLITLVILVAVTNFILLRHLEDPVSTFRNNFCQVLRFSEERVDSVCFQHPVNIQKAQGEVKTENETNQEDLAWHIYRDNGLLEVNPNGPHPIYELIKRGHEEWREKLKRSSSTFEEAVDEYQRRYKRLPPPGFVEWWAYVEKHDVQLPDEYDQIFNDLEPFWGMDPQDLQHIQHDWETHVDSFTVGKDTLEEPISIKNYSLSTSDQSPDDLIQGAFEIIALLEKVQTSIPPFRAVFSPRDNPNLPLNFELRKLALKAARTGTFIDMNNRLKNTPGGWTSSCPPESPARKQIIDWGKAPRGFFNSSDPKSFIYNHRSAMDPCQHPSHFLLHGQFISYRDGPASFQTLVPQFSYSPTMVHQDITAAMPINWTEDLPQEDNPDWDERWDRRLQWRGSNTGIWHAKDRRWDLAQRARLVRWTGDGEVDGLEPLGEMVTVLMPVEERKKVGRSVSIKRERWAATTLDIAFAGEPNSCEPEVCERLREIFEYRKFQDRAKAGRYKYYIDVDGHAWSTRFKRLVTSNALVFKSTVYPEWYTDRIAPWVHYVPIQVDLSDLWDAFVFFRGDPVGNGAHENLAKEIAEAGRTWSKTFWRKEDMVAYMFRLFLEYARVMDPMREKSTYLRPSKPPNRVRGHEVRRKERLDS